MYPRGFLLRFLPANLRYVMYHGWRMYDKEMAWGTRQRITPQIQFFSYNRSIIVCHIRPKHFRFLWFMSSLGVRSPCYLPFLSLSVDPTSNRKTYSRYFLSWHFEMNKFNMHSFSHLRLKYWSEWYSIWQISLHDLF